MTLDQIIEKARVYELADMTGQHNLGEVMDNLRNALVALEVAANDVADGQEDALVRLDAARLNARNLARS